MKALSIFLVIAGFASAQEPTDTLEELQNQYDKLKGYEARYEATTEKGNTAVFEIGVDFKSGWAFLKNEVKDKAGRTLKKSQQWSTDEKLIILEEGNKTIVFEGLGDLGERFTDLQKLFDPDQESSLARITPSAYLTKTGASIGVGFNATAPSWLVEPDKIIASDEKEIQFDWGQHGVITVSRETGLIIKQEISLDEGRRTLKMVELKKNTGPESVAKHFNIEIEGAPRKQIGELEINRGMLRQVFQNLINQMSTQKNGAKNLETLLEQLEDRFVTYLQGEPLDQAKLFEEKEFIDYIGTLTKSLQEKAKESGHEIAGSAFLKHPQFSKIIERRIAETILEKSSNEESQKILNELLGGELQARGRKGKNIRRSVLEFLELSYYRIKVQDAMKGYLKTL